MTPSFERFLTVYCQELAGRKTTSIKLLFKAVLEEAPRAAEPLLLLAIVQNRTDFLQRQAKGTKYESRYRAFAESWQESGQALVSFLPTLPEGNRYRKAWTAWRSAATQLERDRRTAGKVGQHLAALLAEKGLTRAEACRIAGLNKGNFYAFLKGDASKLSRETAVKAYRKIAEV